MAREEKRVTLRTIDEIDEASSSAPEEVIRLGASSGTGTPSPVVLSPEPSAPPHHRLPLPTGGDFEKRTHEPGLEAIVPAAGDLADQLEAQWNRTGRPIPWDWFVLLLLLLAGAVTWSLLRQETGKNNIPHSASGGVTAAVAEAEKERQAAALIQNIETMLRQAFAAPTMEELFRHVRHPDRVRPLMREYYNRTPYRANPVTEIFQLQPITLHLKGTFWVASLRFADGTTANVMLEAEEGHSPLLDWETAVCYQPLPWDEYTASRPADTLLDFRLILSPDTFYFREFSDSATWACYRLEAPGEETFLWGYLRRDNPDYLVLQRLLASHPGMPATVTLRLNIPSGLQARNSVVIESLRSVQWIYVYPPEN